ncbi:MAG: ABC transporter permease [Candidatus Acidiferrales bacterium]
MRNVYSIFRKEMGHYFVSPVAYVIIGLFLAVSALFFTVALAGFMQYSLEASFQGMTDLDVPGRVLQSFFGITSTLFLFFLPMLTMGVYSEERKRGTMELLMTSPISDLQLVLGKFFASLALVVVMLIPTTLYSVFMFLYSEPRPPWKMLLAGYIGLLLLGGALLAIGSLLSSLTENQLIAAVFTFVLLLVLWVIDSLVRNGTGVAAEAIRYLSLTRHYDEFTRGIIDTTGVIYYLSLIGFSTFLTVRALDAMRWRRA